jgi:RNA polymerase sigma factor (sigma-70 family)
MRKADGIEVYLAELSASPDNEDAWRSLFRLLYPFVASVVARRLRMNRDSVEDAVQDVFIRLVKSRGVFEIKDEKALRAYTWIVADNVAKTYRRAAQLKRRREMSLPDDFDGCVRITDRARHPSGSSIGPTGAAPWRHGRPRRTLVPPRIQKNFTEPWLAGVPAPICRRQSPDGLRWNYELR